MGQHIQDEMGRYVFEVVKFRFKNPLNHADSIAERKLIFHIEADDYPTARREMREKYRALLKDPEWRDDVEVYVGVWKKTTSQM